MVSLDEKFVHFSQSVLGKAQQTYENQLNAIEEKNKVLLEQFRAEIEEKALEMKEKTVNQASYEKKMKIARAKLGKKRRVMGLKDELMESLVQQVRGELELFSKSEAYWPFLKDLLAKCPSEVKEMDTLIICLREHDQEDFRSKIEPDLLEAASGRLRDIHYEPLPPEAIGGMIVFNGEKTVRFDLTLQSLLEDQKGVIGELLHEIFDKAGMSDE